MKFILLSVLISIIPSQTFASNTISFVDGISGDESSLTWTSDELVFERMHDGTLIDSQTVTSVEIGESLKDFELINRCESGISGVEVLYELDGQEPKQICVDGVQFEDWLKILENYLSSPKELY